MQKRKIYTVFPEGKYKALTLSYDDGREEDRRLISIFQKYGLKATFNLNSGLADTDPKRIRKEEWPELYDGFEIAAHTVTHPTISRCPLSFVAEEILKDDFLRWKATCHHNHNLLENADAFISFSKSQYLKLMYVWGHSYEFSQYDNWGLIEEFASRISGRNEIWYATNIEIVDYLNASRNLIFTADLSIVYNPSALDLWITVDDAPVKIHGGATVKL